MSHLKKLSDRLRSSQFSSKVLQISTIKDLGSQMLEHFASAPVSITKKLSDFVVPSLIKTAEFHGLASLSSNNVNLDQAAFVIHRNLVQGQWSGYQGGDYEVFISPKVISVEEPYVNDFEFCPSVPLIKAKVIRHHKVKAEYLTLTGEYKEEEFEGFRARVFLHEFDHLEGTFMSSFNVNLGEVECIDKEKHQEIEYVLDKYRKKLNEMMNILDDRYLTDAKFRKQAKDYEDKKDFFIELIVDQDFDGNMHLELIEALKNYT